MPAPVVRCNGAFFKAARNSRVRVATRVLSFRAHVETESRTATFAQHATSSDHRRLHRKRSSAPPVQFTTVSRALCSSAPTNYCKMRKASAKYGRRRRQQHCATRPLISFMNTQRKRGHTGNFCLGGQQSSQSASATGALPGTRNAGRSAVSPKQRNPRTIAVGSRTQLTLVRWHVANPFLAGTGYDARTSQVRIFFSQFLFPVPRRNDLFLLPGQPAFE